MPIITPILAAISVLVRAQSYIPYTIDSIAKFTISTDGCYTHRSEETAMASVVPVQ